MTTPKTVDTEASNSPRRRRTTPESTVAQDLRHQIGTKPSDLDASIPETELPATTDRIVRIEHADHDACDSARVRLRRPRPHH
jgi:hypothetical protein